MRKVIILTIVLMLSACQNPFDDTPTDVDMERACNVYHAVTRNQSLNQAYMEMCLTNTGKRSQTVTDDEADIVQQCSHASQLVYPTTIDSFLGRNGETDGFFNALKRAQIACIEKE